ncbi:MAG: hypothetical protein K8W52_11880 [Deltaproteobacteria bacterium]|nr:hypothetical protein [Deltaproteobacteria bacterium]
MTARALLSLALLGHLGCGADDEVAPPVRVPSPALSDPAEAAPRAVFTVLGQLDRAVARQAPALVDGAFAETYDLVACGTTRRYRAADAVAARLALGTGSAWQVAVAADESMAWARSTGGAVVHLEILERRHGAWQLVAGAVSAADGTAAGCTLGLPGEAPPPLPLAPLLHGAPLASDAELAWCGRTDGNAAMPALDADGDQQPDWLELGPDLAQLSTDAHMAWRLGGSARFQTLAVYERRRAGWVVAAAMWSPDVATNARCATDLSGQRRIITTDTSIEILDTVDFVDHAAGLKPESFPILDAVAATLAGNPGILRIAIEAPVSRAERDPWALSADRGVAVRDYLRARGVAVERLEVRFTAGVDEPRLVNTATFLILKRR